MELNFRQVHLDFHTSEAIQGIAAQFSPDEFADTLDKARVNSITAFARCHHGWMYYDSERFPERVHPHLANKNLLKEQIQACHQRGIRVPIYITVQWDNYTSQRHPEWVVVEPDGKLRGTPPYEAGFYRTLCVHTPYRAFLKAHTREVLVNLPTDGLFFDIVQPVDCSCYYCTAGMQAQGIDLADVDARTAYAVRQLNAFKQEMMDYIREINPDCTVFWNAGHVGPRHRQSSSAYTHYELESLPSGGWGYMHFPMAMRYGRNLGKDCLGMTGKFHTTWGDFHSFKNQAALEFECFQMLALNAKCSIGDQLPPHGKICPTTYDLIGEVYSQVEKKEPYCRQAKPVCEIGLFTPEAFQVSAAHSDLPHSVMGATRMLQEAGFQFDIIDPEVDWNQYKLLILPDDIPVSDDLAQKLDAYVAQGGALIATHESGLNREKTAFTVKSLGIDLVGPAPYSPDFIVPQGDLAKNLPTTEHVIYMQGMQVKPTGKAKTLSEVAVPYFNRNYLHYCSHNHTPSTGKTEYPAAVRQGNCIYFAHPLFKQYQDRAPRWCKQLIVNAVNMLIDQPLVTTNGPSSLITALNDQTQENRRILHLLHYIPERRCQSFDIIEDIIPLHDLEVTVKVTDKVKTVTFTEEDQSLPFTQNGDTVTFTLPKLTGHAIIALQY